MSFPRRAGRTSLRAFAVAAVATAALTVGSQAAFANSTVNVNSSGKGVTAASKSVDHNCDSNFGGGPFPGYDIWVFNLPDHGTSGDFVSVTAQFDTNGDHVADTTKTITTDQPSGIVLNGTSKAWIKLPAGWELEDASAVITGSANFFTLTHTCPAGTQPSPSQSPSESPSSTTPGTPPATTPGTPPGSTAPGTPSNSPSSPGLPVTGSSLTGVLVGGLLLVIAGVVTVFVARRRRPVA